MIKEKDLGGHTLNMNGKSHSYSSKKKERFIVGE